MAAGGGAAGRGAGDTACGGFRRLSVPGKVVYVLEAYFICCAIFGQRGSEGIRTLEDCDVVDGVL